MSANPYYPVTTSSDSAQLTDDDWGLSFTSGKRASVSRFKSLCQKTQSRPRCFIAIFIAVVVLLFLCVIIIVAASKGGKVAQKYPTGNEPARETKTMGVNFFPISEDNSILLSFIPHVFRNNEAIKESMDTVMAAYDVTNQHKEEFVVCNSTYAPYNKTCRLTRSYFGSHCSSHNDYGYQLGSACVLLQLELPEQMTIQQLSKDSDLLKDGIEMPEIVDPAYIPISCKGTAKDDQKMLDMMNKFMGVKDEIQLFPSDGFASFVYRPRNSSLPFIKPAVMVWLPRLPHKHVLHITCTAWGQVYDAQGTPVTHSLLQSSFAFFMDFGEPE